jgi:hypothetical protein
VRCGRDGRDGELSSRLYDREVKHGTYLALGVQEYWLVDLDTCSIERAPRRPEQHLKLALARIGNVTGAARSPTH